MNVSRYVTIPVNRISIGDEKLKVITVCDPGRNILIGIYIWSIAAYFVSFDSHSTGKFVFPPKPSRKNTFVLLIISKGQFANLLDSKL